MSFVRQLSVLCALGVAAPVAVSGEPATLTPQQLIEQVRAQQAQSHAAENPLLAPVPSIADITTPSTRRSSSLDEKVRLEAQLKDVNSALRIKEVTDKSTQHATEAIAARGQMLFTFSPGSIYEIEAKTFHETALQLQPGEVLTGQGLPTAGDTARWTIAATRVGTAPNESVVLIVKPLDANLETNMTITTNRRLYTVILKSSERTYMPLVGWLYPQDAVRDFEERAQAAQKREAEVETLAVNPDQLNFGCEVRGSHVPWRPLRAYDDGSKTYLQMDPQMHSYEAPAVFVMEGKTPMLVNFRVKNSIYIIDRLFERAQLRVGAKSAVDISCIHQFASR